VVIQFNEYPDEAAARAAAENGQIQGFLSFQKISSRAIRSSTSAMKSLEASSTPNFSRC